MHACCSLQIDENRKLHFKSTNTAWAHSRPQAAAAARCDKRSGEMMRKPRPIEIPTNTSKPIATAPGPRREAATAFLIELDVVGSIIKVLPKSLLSARGAADEGEPLNSAWPGAGGKVALFGCSEVTPLAPHRSSRLIAL